MKKNLITANEKNVGTIVVYVGIGDEGKPMACKNPECTEAFTPKELSELGKLNILMVAHPTEGVYFNVTAVSDVTTSDNYEYTEIRFESILHEEGQTTNTAGVLYATSLEPPEEGFTPITHDEWTELFEFTGGGGGGGGLAIIKATMDPETEVITLDKTVEEIAELMPSCVVILSLPNTREGMLFNLTGYAGTALLFTAHRYDFTPSDMTMTILSMIVMESSVQLKSAVVGMTNPS